MTSTTKTHKTAKSSTKSAKSTNTATPDTKETTTMTKPATITPQPTDVATLAKQAAAALQQISAAIPFDDPSAKEAKAAQAASRIPVGAITIAAQILEADPARFPDFSATDTRASVNYSLAMGPLATQIAQLQERLSKSVLNQHAQGAAQALALYQTLKGLSRLSKNKATLTQQKQLGKLITTRTKKRATSVTQKDLQGAAKTLRAAKVTQDKAAKAATANAEAQLAAATEAVATGAAVTATAATPAPATPPSATAPAAPAAVGTGH